MTGRIYQVVFLCPVVNEQPRLSKPIFAALRAIFTQSGVRRKGELSIDLLLKMAPKEAIFKLYIDQSH
jgi:hypothetical protein